MLPSVGALGGVPETAMLQFVLEKEIGAAEGRNSKVYLGTDVQLDAPLVYKQVPLASMPDRDAYWAEARRLHDARHRHVVPIKYACETPDYVYLAMPYYPGGSLHARLDTGPMTVREVVRCGLEFLMGLHHAHVRGVIHFDVKPTNIFFDATGAAALADFGLSRKVDGLGLAEQPSFYRPHTVPERDYAMHLTKAADVYQAGLTLYRMCVGNLAWSAELARLGGPGSSKFEDAVRKGTFPDRKAFPLHIPNRLKTLIREALKPQPDDRTQTALDLMLQLAAVDTRLDWQWARVTDTHQEWRLAREGQQSVLRLTLREVSPGKWWVEVRREGVNPARLHSRCLEGVSEGTARKHVEAIMGQEES